MDIIKVKQELEKRIAKNEIILSTGKMNNKPMTNKGLMNLSNRNIGLKEALSIINKEGVESE